MKIFSIFLCRYQKKLYLCSAFQNNEAFGRLAQLVQSICLTSRGSAVRIRQRPLRKPKASSKEKNRSHEFRAFSSAGSEHLPYKQRVGGSNPSTPTTSPLFSGLFCLHLPRQTISQRAPYTLYRTNLKKITPILALSIRSCNFATTILVNETILTYNNFYL